MTLGYSGLRVETVKTFLVASGARLTDIRRVPYSRDQSWCREPLRGALGPAYVWLGWSLGNENWRSGPIKLADPEKGVGIVSALLQVQPIVLCCVCRDWKTCHRRLAAELIRRD